MRSPRPLAAVAAAILCLSAAPATVAQAGADPCAFDPVAAAGLRGEDGAGTDLSGAVERLEAGCRAMQADRDHYLSALRELRRSVGNMQSEVLAADTRYRVAWLAQQELRLAHERSLQRHQDRIFDWQLTALQLVTFITVLMTVAGLVVAVREIPRSLRPAGGPKAGAAADATHQVALGPGSVSVTTAAAWVVMLALALGYLYLFVSEVMDLEPVDFGLSAGRAASAPEAAAEAPPQE